MRCTGWPGQSFALQMRRADADWLELLIGTFFVLQTNRNGPDWMTVLIDTLQTPVQEVVLPPGNYRLIPLEDLLLKAPLSVVCARATAEQPATVSVTGSPGQPFVLEGSEDMQVWTSLHADILTCSPLTLRDDASLPLHCRFYRVRPTGP